MTSPPSPPNRRRRRWLIVTALAVASLVSWWYWPRRDARFVGKWTWTEDHVIRLLPTVQFQSNGVIIASGPSTLTSWSIWMVRDDTLVLGSSPKGRLGVLSRRFSRWLSTKTTTVELGSERVYKIWEANGDFIVLSDWTDGPSVTAHKVTLTRIPE